MSIMDTTHQYTSKTTFPMFILKSSIATYVSSRKIILLRGLKQDLVLCLRQKNKSGFLFLQTLNTVQRSSKSLTWITPQTCSLLANSSSTINATFLTKLFHTLLHLVRRCLNLQYRHSVITQQLMLSIGCVSTNQA